MNYRLTAILLLMQMKMKKITYKRFAEEAGINLKKLYNCSSPGRCQLMSDEFAQEIIDGIRRLYPADYDYVIDFYGDDLKKRKYPPLGT